MNWETITEYAIWATVVVLSVYDIFVIRKAGVEASISRRMLLIGQQFPIIPFAFGVLIGHLYWQNC